MKFSFKYLAPFLVLLAGIGAYVSLGFATNSVIFSDGSTLTLNWTSPAVLEAGDLFVDTGAIWTMTGSSPVIVYKSSGSISNLVPGSYILEYTQSSSGETLSISGVIQVQDTIAPIVNLNGSSTQTIEASTGTYVDSGASYTDTVIGIGTIPVATSGAVNMKVPGVYTLGYSKTDTSGNTGTTNRTVTITDTTAPSLVLNGSSTQTLEAFSGTYVDSGATWDDIVDGTGVVTAYSGSVNTKVPGIYMLQYRKIDAHGNTGSTLSRTVTVVDTTAPALILSGSTNMTVEASLGLFSEPGATWDDIVDGTGSILNAYSGSVSMRIPGVYALQYQKVDAHGNTGSIARSVTVVDTTAPSIGLNGSGSLIWAHGLSYVDSGATWDDIVDGTGVVTAYSGSVNTNMVGTYILQYRKIDAHGNTGSVVSRSVTVTDQTVPTLTLNGANPETVYIGSVYTDSMAKWIDAVDGSGNIVAFTGIVNTSTLGTYTLQYKKTDLAGNTSSTISRTVNVVNPPSGGGPSSGGGGGGGGGGGSYVAPVVVTVNSGSTSTGGLNSGSILSSTGITVAPAIKKNIIIRKPIVIKKTPQILVSTGNIVPSKIIVETKTQVKPSIEVTQKPPVTPQGNILKVNERKLNIRLAPSLDAKILGYLVFGDTVEVISEQDGWIQFKYGKIIGWSKRGFFLTESSGQIVATSPMVSSTPSRQIQDDIYFANAPRINIRVEPTSEAKTERFLVGGQNCQLITVNGKWAKVRTEDGYEGWVAFRYILKR